MGREQQGVRAWVTARGTKRWPLIGAWALVFAGAIVLAQTVAPPTPPPDNGGIAPMSVIQADLVLPNGTSYTPPATVPMQVFADVGEDGEQITQVKFYANGSQIGTDTSVPYSFTWTNVPAGAYAIHAVAFSNQASSLQTNTENITVSAATNQAPSVSLTSPTNGQVMLFGPSVSIAANASDADGSIQRVEFYVTDTLIATDTAAPYATTWTPPGVGTYAIKARAYDNAGAASEVTHTLKVHTPPTVDLNAPAPGTYQGPLSLTVQATATDNGTVTQVEFYNGATLLATDTTAPFAYAWPNIPSGSYSFTARATDDDGVSTTSSAVAIIVNSPPSVAIASPTSGTVLGAPASPLVQATASDPDDSLSKVEFYLDGTLQVIDTAAPFAWQASGLAAGTYSLTAKAFDTRGGVTVSAASSLIVNALPSASLSAPSTGTLVQAPGALTLSATASDADGSITKVDFYAGATLVATDNAAPYTQVWTNVPAGVYSLTAKATDNRGGVSTTTASLATVNAPPTVSVTAPANNSAKQAPANVTIEASASDADDSLSKVEFFQGATLLATDTTVPFAHTQTGMTPGTYTLTAKAYDSRGGITTSAASTLIVSDGPTVQLTAPLDQSGAVLPNTVTLAATASVAGGTIAQVEFFAGSTSLGVDTTAPYSVNWTPSATGDYTLTAKATDNLGLSGTSTGALLRVRANAIDLLGDQSLVSLLGELPAHDVGVGRVAGQGGVSGGAATYSIPIVVPPGRRGMQPSLSLDYSSRAGNGIAGMGWSLSGLSSIHRCPQTLEQDGQIRAVKLDASDRLCLDGQRLVLTGGTYGAVNATYGTELESFVRVTQLGGNLSATNSYFKVERKSGEIAYYGNTTTAASAARVVPGGVTVPLTWMQVRNEDRIGNRIDYVYSSYGNGETLVSSIYYTGFGATLGNRRVAFNYEARPSGGNANDRASSYLAGGLTRQTQRLASVVTFVGTEAVRSWVLNYGSGVSATTGRSLLQTVSDCAHDGSQWWCKAPTSFVWQQGAMTFDLKVPNLVPASLGAKNGNISPLGDMDGDGATEVLVDYGTIVSLTPERTVRWSMSIPPVYAIHNLGKPADFNQDGRVDFVARDTATSRIVIRTWNGSPSDTNFASAFGNLIDTGITVPGDTSSVDGLVHVGDMDGDGRADIVLVRAESPNAGSCSRKVYVYRNTPNPTTPTAAPTFPEVATHCMSVPHVGDVMYEGEQVQGVRDFDGDGLSDILVESALEAWTPYVSQGRKLDRILFGTRTTTGYSLTSTPFAAVFPVAQPRDAHENKSGLFALWIDVNGDGLEDWLYVGYDKVWKLRYNRGGVFSAIYSLGTSAGLAGCGSSDSTSQSLCAHVWTPWQAQHLRPSDIDGDGRSELLFPSGFAANMCVLKPESVETCIQMGMGQLCTAGSERWVCPEDPVTGAAPPVVTRVASDLNNDGHPELNTWHGAVTIGAHDSGWPDYSTYTMSALRITEAADGSPVVSTVATSQLSGAVNLASDDLYGDGHTDALLLTSPEFGSRDVFGIPVEKGDGTPITETQSPRTLPGGLPIFTANVLLLENTGPAAAKNLDGLTPQTQDVIGLVTDGLGIQTVWSYAPLASKAGRTVGQTPLYTVPMIASQRYIDERHIYFTSSMNVVAQMSQSDGIGGFRTWRYGYGEAMYNTQGRGFQGFRTIVEEDETAGLRTTTTFHQKFPLTSQPERIVVNPISRTGEDGAISRETYAWRCNLANRADTAACIPTYGTPKKYFPFLDTKESWTYDATTAAAGGTPAVLGYTQEVSAADTTCVGTFATASGYDAYGNLKARTTHRRDLGTGSASGTANRLDRQCVSEANTYTTTTSTWWLDKLTKAVVKTKVVWDTAQHPLPVGTSNPFHTVTTDYVWNTNRTLSTETVQAGIANQQRVTAYTYPTTNNYGLPSGVGVTASGDPNGSRSVGTTYSADGYFPQTVANALGHSATNVVRARDGQPSQTTDANGLRTLIDYDAFGFAIKKRLRGTTDSVYVTPDAHTAVSACLPTTCSPGEVYQVTQVQDGAPTQIARIDALGRTRSTAQRQMDGVWTETFTEYAPRGHVARQSAPLRTGESGTVWTLFEHNDVLGRMTKKTVPKQAEDGRGDLVTTYAYGGRTTSIQVCGSNDVGTANCLNLSRTTDSAGRYIETRDALNGRTRFWYESNGNVAAIEDAKGVVTKAAYNAIGQRSGVNDPNQGNWSFVYNALGEVLSQTDARGIVTSLTYDKLGRPLTRNATVDATGDGTADAVADTWTYDPTNAKGAPLSEQRTINGAIERSETTTYDALARPIQTDVTQALMAGTQTYAFQTRYDSYYGRPVGQMFPNGEAVRVVYGVYGDALAEQDPVSGAEYRRLNSVNARDQAMQETFGNGVVLNPQYQTQTGQLTELRYSKSGIDLRKLGYGYDVFGNLKRQTLNAGQSQEDYQYDQLHRMISAIRSGAATGTVNYGFDAVGNFTKKTDFSANSSSAYVYTGGACGGGANAVKSVMLLNGTTRTYCYDANGNLTSDNAGLSIQYDHQNLPTVAQRGGLRDDFRYGADGMRTRSWGSDGSRVYLPGYEHRLDTNETKVYVGDYAVITNGGGNPRKIEYLLKDRLGSVDAIANSSGTVTETRGYDAFGKPRSGTWADLSPAKMASTAVTPKGFTQHEHLNQLELIHMNGRVFDYNLGRFTGVDPFIQFPLNSQSLNPYSYILNNPLSGTDPTGYACSTGTHIKGDAGPNCEGSNMGGTPMSENPTQARALVRTRPELGGPVTISISNGAVACGTSGADGRSSEETQPQEQNSSEGQQTLETIQVPVPQNSPASGPNFAKLVLSGVKWEDLDEWHQKILLELDVEIVNYGKQLQSSKEGESPPAEIDEAIRAYNETTWIYKHEYDPKAQARGGLSFSKGEFADFQRERRLGNLDFFNGERKVTFYKGVFDVYSNGLPSEGFGSIVNRKQFYRSIQSGIAGLRGLIRHESGHTIVSIMFDERGNVREQWGRSGYESRADSWWNKIGD